VGQTDRSIVPVHAIVSSASARRLLATSVIARLPLAMLGVGLLVDIQRLTGSFATAGAVTGAYGTAVGVGAPVLGRMVDRHGQNVVLLMTAWVGGGLLGAIALLPAGIGAAVPLMLAVGVGLATPPVAACLRTQLPLLVDDRAAAGEAYALETTLVELTWVCGPPLALGLGALWSPAGAIAAAAVVLVLATLAFTLQPSSHWRTSAEGARSQVVGSLRSPAMRTLALVLLGVGVLLGADEVGVTAAARSQAGTTAWAAPLLALWGAGSFAGGLLASRSGAGARSSATNLTWWLSALTVGHLALIPCAGNIGALAVMLPLAGATIAPAEAAVYAAVEASAALDEITEAFSWLVSAIEIGAALGAAGAGVLVDRLGSLAAFGLGGAGCACAALIAASHTHRGAAIDLPDSHIKSYKEA
jgi:predicted MFS family arabinose efflux permease